MNILTGLSGGLRGWTSATQPSSWDEFIAAMEASSQSDDALSKAERNRIADLSLLFGGGRAIDDALAMVADESVDIGVRRSTLESLVDRTDGPTVQAACLAVLSDPRLNPTAARGLAKSADPAVADALLKNYRRFRAPQRPGVVAILCSRAVFAERLLDAVASDRLPADELSAYDVRQLRSLGDENVTRRVAAVWGDVRDATAAQQLRITQLHDLLSQPPEGGVDLSNGRRLFAKSCAACHRLYGEGGEIGPDLTGGNRMNLDYLLENIVTPSAIVSKNYRMSLLRLVDGRVLSGLIVSEDDETLRLQTQTELMTVAVDDIEARKLTDLSPMPEGLLDRLSEQELRDLFGYLRSPAQVPLATAEN